MSGQRGRGRGRLSLQTFRRPNRLDESIQQASRQSPRPQDGEESRLISLLNPNELTQLLECPVCYEIALPPVIMCTSGHNICSECRSQCPRCPVCRAGFCEARNRLAENIVERCSVICRYKSLGCGQVLNGRLMAKHLDEDCDFRPVLCRDCKLKVPFEEYINHMMNVENLPKQIATECSTGFDIDEEDFSHCMTDAAGGMAGQSWEPTWLYCYDTNFFCHMESNNSLWWIYVIAFTDDAVLDNFLCDILVWNRDKKQEIRFHGRIHSYRKTGEEILATGQCLITSETAVRSILNQGGIDVVVCILRSSEFQSPTSRITNQPIYSPLTLRDINNNNDTSGTISDSISNCGTSSTTVPAVTTPHPSTIVSQIPRPSLSPSNSSLQNESGNSGDAVGSSWNSQSFRSRQIAIPENPRVEEDSTTSRHYRPSRIDQITRSQVARSRSLETGRRRRQGIRTTPV